MTPDSFNPAPPVQSFLEQSFLEQSFPEHSLNRAAAVGIDTMHIFFSSGQFKIAFHHQLKIEPACNGKPNCLLGHQPDGTAIEGAYAWWRGPHGIHITIKPPKRRGKRDFIGVNTAICKVTFSVASICGAGDNYRPAGLHATQDAIVAVQRALVECGVMANVEGAAISRVDLFRNVILSEPITAFQPIISALAPPRMQIERYRTGMTCRNQSHGWCLYDKIAERSAKGMPTTGLPSHVLRVEYRIHQAKKVREVLGIHCVHNLLRRFPDLDRLYSAQAKRDLFPHSLEDLRSGRRPRQSAIQRQIIAVLRWCESKEITPPFDAPSLLHILESRGITGFQVALESVDGMCPRYRRQKVRDMKKAVLREVVQADEAAASRYAKLRGKVLRSETASVQPPRPRRRSGGCRVKSETASVQAPAPFKTVLGRGHDGRNMSGLHYVPMSPQHYTARPMGAERFIGLFGHERISGC